MKRVDAFLELAVRQGGSDLHLLSGLQPRIRAAGELQPVAFRELSASDLDGFLTELMDAETRARFEQHHAVDFAYVSETAGRFRANVYRHARGLAAVLRVIPEQPPSLESIGLPPVLQQMLSLGTGLVLVTGPTGSGKSTTLAGMVDWYNRTQRGHIITLEDPIEFVHASRQCVVTQREIGRHAPTFATALHHAMREDPNVLLVGDLRDLETTHLALTAAETGVLVLATMHTSGAVRTINRIINVFPPGKQEQVRTMLADSLRLVVSQQLVRRLDGTGRIVAAEILVNTVAVSAMVRSGNTHKLSSVLQANQRLGMQTLDSVLQDLVRREIISAEEAGERAVDRAQFDRYTTGDTAA